MTLPDDSAEIRSNDATEKGPSDGTVADSPQISEDDSAWAKTRVTRSAIVGTTQSTMTRRIGHYRLIEEIGRGGQGHVFLAEDERLSRKVALKILTEASSFSPEARERFQREALAASRLHHPGICAVYEASGNEGVPFIAMQLIDGETLAKKISAAKAAHRDGQEPAVKLLPETGEVPKSAKGSTERNASEIAEAARSGPSWLAPLLLIEKAARALHAAHEAGLVHRDVKPANIMVSADLEPILLDFGLAHDEAAADGLTRTNDVLGTPNYMSPEQAAGNTKRIDARTDVYSLGVCLFECLAMRVPFKGATPAALARAIVQEPAPDVRKFNRRIPADLSVVVATALEKDLTRRYRTAAEFADDLERVKKTEPIAARPISTLGRFVRWTRREPLLATIYLLTVLLVGAGGFVAAKWKEIDAGRRNAERQRIDAMIDRTWFLIGTGDQDGAEEIADEIIRISPSEPEGWAARAVVDIERFRSQKALERLASPSVPKHANTDLDWLRLAALDRGPKTTEMKDLEARIEEPKTALGYFLAGYFEIQRAHERGNGDYSRALERLDLAVSLSPRAIYYFRLAETVSLTKDEKAARRIARAIEVRFGGSAVGDYWYARALESIAPAEALVAVERSLTRDPRSAAAFEAKARILLNLGKTDEWKSAIASAIANHPRPQLVYQQFGAELMNRKMHSEADEFIGEGAQRFPKNAMLQGHLGMIRMRMGQWSEARAFLEREQRLAGRFMEHSAALARCIAQDGEPEKALAILDELEARGGQGIDITFNRAICWMLLGKKAEALVHVKKYNELWPTDPMGWDMRGTLELELGNDDAALESFKKAFALAPQSPGAARDLAIQLGRMRRWDESAEIFEKFLSLAPNDAEANFMTAQVLRERFEFRRALTLAKKAHELGRKLPDWKRPSGDLIEKIAKEVEAQDAIDRFVADGTLPDDSKALEAAAELARKRRHSRTGYLLYRALIDRDPKAFDDGRRPEPFVAAALALEAAFGIATDSGSLNGLDKRSLRDAALSLMDAHITKLASTVQKYPYLAPVAVTILEGMDRYPGYAYVKKPETLESLPPAEAAAWRELLKRIQRKVEEWAD